MKTLAFFLTTVALCAGSAIPLVPGDNSHYIEGESRYIWMPNGQGVPQLVDLEVPIDPQVISTARNGANNQYWLYTRNNPTTPQILINGNANSVINSNYLGSRPTKVLIHGWNSDGNSEMNPMITAAFLAVADVNVIILDWRALANGLYTAAVLGTPSVGQHLGRFLIWLLSNFGGNWNQLHLVGFSIGAHIAGNAGRTFSSRGARITGLDPSGPQFGGNSIALNRNDALYVESIHTDGGLLGIMDPISDADFYPNGGRNPQPGCLISICSHSRVTHLFAASVRFNHFVGSQCANLGQAELGICSGAVHRMGNSDWNKRGSGLFGLRTGSSWPF